MPYNQTMAEQKLLKCETSLRNLFVTNLPIPTVNTPQESITSIIEYYNNLYESTKADDHQTINAILQDYEQFVSGLEAVKAGTLDMEEMKKRINESTDQYYFGVLKNNVAQVCMGIFWISTAISLYVSLFLIALPMLAVVTPIGVAVGVALGGFLAFSIKKIIDCVSNFQSFEPHAKDYHHKHSTLNFFKPTQTPDTEQTKKAETQEEDVDTKEQDDQYANGTQEQDDSYANALR